MRFHWVRDVQLCTVHSGFWGGTLSQSSEQSSADPMVVQKCIAKALVRHGSFSAAQRAP